MESKIKIRPAIKEDVELILYFINQLASYELMKRDVIATPELLIKWIFEEDTACVLIAEYDGVPAGFALYFNNFSTFLGRPGIYLEDLFVLPQYRRKGIGKSIFTKLAEVCIKNDYGRLEWSCLDWNEKGIAFYESMDAVMLKEWRSYRLTGESLNKLAKDKSNE